jgi:hypothetical protein
VSGAPGPVRSAFDWFFRSRRTGKVTVVQVPNLPLGIYLGATAVRVVAHPQGGLGSAVAVAGNAGLAWWAADEVLRGDCPFRRVAGGVVLGAMGVALLTR